MSFDAGECLRHSRAVGRLAEQHRRKLVRLADHAFALHVDLACSNEQLRVRV